MILRDSKIDFNLANLSLFERKNSRFVLVGKIVARITD